MDTLSLADPTPNRLELDLSPSTSLIQHLPSDRPSSHRRKWAGLKCDAVQPDGTTGMSKSLQPRRWGGWTNAAGSWTPTTIETFQQDARSIRAPLPIPTFGTCPSFRRQKWAGRTMTTKCVSVRLQARPDPDIEGDRPARFPPLRLLVGKSVLCRRRRRLSDSDVRRNGLARRDGGRLLVRALSAPATPGCFGPSRRRPTDLIPLGALRGAK
ncbi:hypothetical protein DFJ73DRAFT_768894 [Zopfochytrium polystomum]|nr:hypothetical protein DFJ73DRAFT_768894 [Zopfochytrium polystomum]